MNLSLAILPKAGLAIKPAFLDALPLHDFTIVEEHPCVDSPRWKMKMIARRQGDLLPVFVFNDPVTTQHERPGKAMDSSKKQGM